jgi:hypothetical protein
MELAGSTVQVTISPPTRRPTRNLIHNYVFTFLKSLTHYVITDKTHAHERSVNSFYPQ